MKLFKKNTLPEGITSSSFECRRDTLTLRGTQYRPAGDHLPIAIVCHGFMAWQDSVRHYALTLAQCGYAAFCFDFAGGSVMNSQSDGATTDMSVLTEVRDLEAVIQYVRTLPHVDPDNILLMGCSQGGFVCALTAAKHAYPVRKLCLFYPALCIPDDARAGHMMMAHFDPANVPETFRCGPMKLGRRYVTDVIGMNALEEIKSYSGDVLIVHGDADRIVHIDYSRRAFAAYEEIAPAKVRLCVIPGGGHMFSKKQDVQAIAALKCFAADN